jgi:hypothetical protein
MELINEVPPIKVDGRIAVCEGGRQQNWTMQNLLIHTPSGLVKEDVLDKIWVKHWEYKSWITFNLLSLEMWKLHE